ncbi:uncharacterized protein LOC109949521 [Prunus persica]|uniref:uncharacterized protein LOC109949521 n=1 Tax=Prunus persica TaxID=3760 RepID=UPI0009AB2281|nr:uncharacterized protein LOC109949521 [Prunus persica]
MASKSHHRCHRPPPATRLESIEPPSLPLPFPTSPAPETAGFCRKKLEIAPILTENSPASFVVVRPPFLTIQAPGHQLTRRRDLQKVQRARTSCRRRASESHHRAVAASCISLA